jgi:hypothetical protein
MEKEHKTGSITECIKTIIDNELKELEEVAETMYSEEEVLDILCARSIELKLYESREKLEEWFSQLKK